MNKGDLVNAVAAKTKVTKKDAEAVITAALEEIMRSVSGGDKMTLVGFGTFEQITRQARTGRNPKTGEPLEIPASQAIRFSAGKAFKDMVNF